LQSTRIDLPSPAPGTRRQLLVQRFGRPGARPKAYLQAALHADELPGVLVLGHLTRLLGAVERIGRLKGEIVLVPAANPIGLAQSVMGSHLGRYDLAPMTNFNRGWPDLVANLPADLATQLGPDPRANVAVVRAALVAAGDSLPALGENAFLRRTLVGLAVDADIALDLHCDAEAALHLYLGDPLWPDAQDLAAEIGAEAVLLAEESGGNPFDEMLSAPWWQLARRFPEHPIPQGCLSGTVEYRGLRDINDEQAEQDAEALLRFLMRRGLIDGAPGPLPPAQCEATPLTGAAMVESPVSGLVLFDLEPGQRVIAGDRLARIIDPLAGPPVEAEVTAPTSGMMFARVPPGLVRAGEVVAKIAGAEPLPGRGGNLLPN
jgi:predicted deacylase